MSTDATPSLQMKTAPAASDDPRPIPAPSAANAPSPAATAPSLPTLPNMPPVVLLGGEANALSVARDLSRMGVRVYAIGEPQAAPQHSRCCRWISVPPDGGFETAWADYLLGPQSDFLRGAVILACSDAGIRLIARHREALLGRYRLDESNPSAQIALLDKLSTYELAQAAGTPAPAFWKVDSCRQVQKLRDELVYPLMIKPRLSHLFEEQFGRKHMIVDGFDELMAVFNVVSNAGMEVLLMEVIPGPDDRLCSYFTYLDERGTPLFHFTKRIIRRFPAGMGTACYHITDWIPALVEPSVKLFNHAGLRGLANVEFKYDERDGQYKLIECNARFTASNSLVTASGFGLAEFVYNRIVGRPQQPLVHYQSGLRMWDPLRDFQAFLELRKTNRITFGQWLGSILHRHRSPYFAWSDPMPTMARMMKPLRKRLKRK